MPVIVGAASIDAIIPFQVVSEGQANGEDEMMLVPKWGYGSERHIKYCSVSNGVCGSRMSFRWQYPQFTFDQLVIQNSSQSDKRGYSTCHGKRKSYSMHYIMFNGRMTPTY
jgi:hypothetical protein